MDVILSRVQIRRVDDLAINHYGIPGPVLMENAGRNASALIRESYGPVGGAVVFCGPGNNGGDGCVIARHLHNAGWTVRVMVTGGEAQMSDDLRTNFRIIKAMGLEPQTATDKESQLAFARSIEPDDVVIDALLGTGFQGEVRSPTAELIDAINAAAKRAVVAVDIPSGLDCDSGTPSNATIRADLTVTFVAKKTGLVAGTAGPYVGRLEVADIGAPGTLPAEIASGKP
jgi:NAD(P)H-hydrate epimerase